MLEAGRREKGSGATEGGTFPALQQLSQLVPSSSYLQKHILPKLRDEITAPASSWNREKASAGVLSIALLQQPGHGGG